MAILTGRLTCTRFKVSDARLARTFTTDDLAALTEHAIGKRRVAAGDGSDCGWTAGDHVLDTTFDLAKNVVDGGNGGDVMHFALRIDQTKVPAELLLAYTQVELKGLVAAAGNPSGKASARQRREAKAAAKSRIEEEARDGRWLRRKAIPVLWDSTTGELLAATTSATTIDHLRSLFRETFGVNLEFIGAGQRAAIVTGIDASHLEGVTPSAFAASHAGEISWQTTESDHNFLGNEFLLWLWYYLEQKSDTVKLADGSEVVVMLSNNITLDCPRGQTGKDTIKSDGPTRLPEALRAAQAGKMPRKAGMILVRHSQQYELTLNAETLAIGSAKLPVVEGKPESEQCRREERVTAVRELLETADLLYEAFIERRLGERWGRELVDMKLWLARTERTADTGQDEIARLKTQLAGR